MPPITLRPVEDHDEEALFAVQSQPTATRMTAFGPPVPMDRSIFALHLHQLRADKSVVARSILAEGEVAGWIVASDTGRIPQIAFGIDPERWRRGLATAALIAFTTTMKRRPLQAVVGANNPAAIRVLEKAGFARMAGQPAHAPARPAEVDAVRYELSFFPAPTYKAPPPP